MLLKLFGIYLKLIVAAACVGGVLGLVATVVMIVKEISG